MTTQTVSTSIPTTADRVAVVVPDQPAAAKSWRRLIRTIDHDRQGAFALNGPTLEPGAVYELPSGAVVVVVDTFPDRRPPPTPTRTGSPGSSTGTRSTPRAVATGRSQTTGHWIANTPPGGGCAR